jgi:hypothetical protein
MTDYWDVWVVATTNSCVSFVARVQDVPAATGPEAGAMAIAHALENGLSITLMLQSPPLPVTPVSCVPFRIEKVNRVSIASNIPKP